jgi:alpha-beta hydrolase superfamily lysophospholipase
MTTRHFLHWLVRVGLLLLLLLVAAILAWGFSSRNLPDLKPWHVTELPSQFDRADIEAMTGLDDYMAREALLFTELDELVYGRVESTDQLDFNRYNRASATDPTSRPQDYNRSYQSLPEGQPLCGALMVHGLTDSPYSMRHLARIYTDAGCYALALRMPGHGTIPNGLIHADSQDWASAVALGARAVRDRIGDKVPLFLVGYSNGGALVMSHALEALDDPGLAAADGVMLFSPMIGVTPFSRLADLGQLLTWFEYFEKFSWLDVLPEYDPYKYNSFPKNAGYQTYVVTQKLQQRLQSLESEGRLREIPPVLSFQSLVDATVSTPAVVNELYARLKAPGSDLVLFDLNRSSTLAPFLAEDHRQFVENLLTGPELDYDITLIGNRSKDSNAVAEWRRPPNTDKVIKKRLNLEWPAGVYSLSHVAIVFPPEDEFYGDARASRAAGNFPLGSLNPRGERGVTIVPVSTLLRLRHNPFFDYMAERLRVDIARFLNP